jgi:hypothetical protein
MTMTINDSTALVPANQAMPAARLTALEKYGRSGAGGLFGDLLRFSGKTGVWAFGSQNTEVPIGTRLVAIIPQLVAGYIRWQDGAVADQVIQPINESYDPKALRTTLGDVDPDQWPKGDDGRAEDPWRESVLLPLKNLATGAEYTYSTSSLGGCRCVKRLIAAFALQMRQAPETTSNHLPVVELGANPYKHSDRRRGTIYNPVLTGIDWVPASAVTDKNAGQTELPLTEPPFEDHREPKKRRRKASL